MVYTKVNSKAKRRTKGDKLTNSATIFGILFIISYELCSVSLGSTRKVIKFKIKISEKSEQLIPDDLKVNIFRIIQEQIQNVTKHSNATAVSININITGDSILEIVTTDNGKGFDTKKKKPGVGIINIMNRVASFNGNCSIISAPKQGCTFKISFPLK